MNGNGTISTRCVLKVGEDGAGKTYYDCFWSAASGTRDDASKTGKAENA